MVHRVLSEPGNRSILDPISPQQVNAVQSTMETTFPCSINTVSIMYLYRTIQADANLHIMGFKEITPFLGDKCCICLKRVNNPYTTCVPPILEFKGLPIEANRQDKRFSCMPQNDDLIGYKMRRK